MTRTLNSTSSSSGIKHSFIAKRGEIDGLRAIAVIFVLLYHARFGFSGGYVGVDVFFVISGFLVTSMLLREIELHNYISLSQFWGRRIRRLILPVSLVTVVTVVVGYLTLEPFRLRALAYDALAAAMMNSNTRYALTTSDYLSGLTLPSPLLHLWSLGVEEQFYLVLPLLVVVSLRFFHQRLALTSLLIICTIASLLASIYFTVSSPAAAYYYTPTRAWELLAGSLLALVAHRVSALPTLLRSVLGWSGLIVIIFAAIRFNGYTSFPGYAALLPVLGTVGVLVAAELGSGRVLALPLLQWLGVRSYSLYLWHWPVLVLSEAQIGPMNTTQRTTALLFSILLADLTYRFVEQPFRYHPLLERDWLASFRAGGALTAIVASSALILLFISPANAKSLPDVALSTETTAKTQPFLQDEINDPIGKVLLLGDSTLAPLRWFKDGSRSISGFNYRLEAESCRRLAFKSCEGREKRTPISAAPFVDKLSNNGQRYKTAIVMGGYHSTPSTIGEEFELIVKALRSNGTTRILFVEFRESLAYPAPGTFGKKSVYTLFNKTIRNLLSSGSYPDVLLLPWNTYSASHGHWFRTDGIHINLEGSLALGVYFSDTLASIEGKPCHSLQANVPCSIPTLPAKVDLFERFSVSPTDIHCYHYGTSRREFCEPDIKM